MNPLIIISINKYFAGRFIDFGTCSPFGCVHVRINIGLRCRIPGGWTSLNYCLYFYWGYNKTFQYELNIWNHNTVIIYLPSTIYRVSESWRNNNQNIRMYFMDKHGGWGGGRRGRQTCRGDFLFSGAWSVLAGGCGCARRVKNVSQGDLCSDAIFPFIISIYFMLGVFIFCIGRM